MFIHVPANYMYTPSCHHHQPPPPSGRPNLPNQTGYTIPQLDNLVHRITQSQDNPVPEPTTHRQPHLHISVRVIKNYHPKVYVCSINFTVSIPIHGIDSNVVSPYHIGVSHI